MIVGRGFPASTEANTYNKVVAPLLEHMGMSAAKVCYDSLLPNSVVSRLPSYNSMAEQIMLFGALTDTILFGYEPNLAACMRMQTSGVCVVLAISAPHAVKYIQDIKCTSKLTWQMFSDALTNMTGADGKACIEKGLKVYSGIFERGMALHPARLPRGHPDPRPVHDARAFVGVELFASAIHRVGGHRG